MRARSPSPADQRPTKRTNDSIRDHRSNFGEKDGPRPRTDRHSSTRPGRNRQRSRSQDLPTDGGRYNGQPADRRHDRQAFHPSKYLGYDYTGRESRRSEGLDSRGRYSPPDGRRIYPLRPERFPPNDRRERARHRYLHPNDYSDGQGEFGTADEYTGDEYTDDEYDRDEDEYADDG